MNIVIKQPHKAECFAALFQHIKAFTEHINIMFEKERLYVQAMDNSHISIFEISLPAEWFDEYTLPGDSTITIGVSSSILFRVLNARDRNQEINLVLAANTSDKLCIHFTGENKSEFDKHFELSLMEIDSDCMQIPVIDYQAELTLSSAYFANLINQLKLFGDTLNIKCTEEKVEMCSKSLEEGKMFVEIKMEDISSFAINEGETVHLSFSLAFLHNICLYNKLAKEIEMKLSSDYPMKIIYRLQGHDDAQMVFFLAPKVDEA
jgi:proliferating cell nuclear antigen PCNA